MTAHTRRQGGLLSAIALNWQSEPHGTLAGAASGGTGSHLGRAGARWVHVPGCQVGAYTWVHVPYGCMYMGVYAWRGLG